MFSRIAIVGSQGAIGEALIKELCRRFPDSCIYAFSRNPVPSQSKQVITKKIEYQSEESIMQAAQQAGESGLLDCVIVTIGILHDTHTKPEKSLKNINRDSLNHIFNVNTFTPIMIAKHFIPILNKKKSSLFAALSARVGSIGDNRLGGWYAYRASKSALNMLLKTLAIEVNRFSTYPIILGLHPGTVDSKLSKPFQKNVPEEKIFTPAYSASKLCDVLTQATPEDSGKCFAWDGQAIIP